MTLSDNIDTISTALDDIHDAIVAKGVTPSGNITTYATAIGQISGGDSGGKFLVRVIDYDGTILKQDHLNTGATFTLPTQPTHSRLTFKEWISPVTITNNTVTVSDSDITIGAMYYTTSGSTEFDIKLNSRTGKTVTLSMGTTRNWGDGTTDSSTSHTYADYGEYTITCDGNSVPSSTFNAKNYLINAFLSTNVTTIGDEAFRDSLNLSSIIMPNVSTVGTYALFNTGLVGFVCPTSLTGLPDRMFQSAFMLSRVALPYGTLILGQYCFNGGNFDSFTIPSTVTQLGDYLFNYYHAIQRLTIPSSVTTVGERATSGYQLSFGKVGGGVSSFNTSNQVFYNASHVKEYDFTEYESVPTLASTSALKVNEFSIIKVPTSLASSWKTASNWSTYADNIVGV